MNINKTNINNDFDKPLDSSKNIQNKKNLIFGIISKFSLNRLFPFFKSWTKANLENCDMVIFLRYFSPKIIDYLKNIGVLVYVIPKQYRNIKINKIRWKIYIDFLKSNKNKYNLVLHLDVIDTIFQGDIFSYYKDYESFLGISLEDITIKDWINKNWIIDLIGKKI